ncbi:MAG: hypothetical protein A2W90_00110 [Bacteroidetes bacterium GWF2_42_66]|nr:MAG: hypothetical protein A2W92_09290 [Bacteroidetes bacterium GWA2_42_15]OFX97890.1 MAG: hypothetical protein A2W89_07475 [Bacteroidetes bacterium GWE2_42_39]OFY44133.1 MAG: hypothetical protein A2W90_00110 [Bacteroidetes bacterium GWF2_42_66]HAZ03406.1 hypothetical protein [Marinilabiliales bacterium]HBL74623.1 hypothetical protein [Prolixibacteraceae bacterium]
MRKIGILIFLTFLIAGIKCFGEGKDLRPQFEKYSIPIYTQGERGTCSVFAIVGLLEFEYACKTGQYTPLSVEYLNWASNKITGELNDGTYFSDAVKAINKYGICENSVFPYYIKNYSNKVEPSKTATKDAKKRRGISPVWIKEWDAKTGMSAGQIAQVKSQLNNGHPVAIGFRWPKKDERYSKEEKGLMYIPPEEGVFDGHSVLIVGYQDMPKVPGGGYFIFKNSHGPNYSENGYGKMPYGYVEKYANDGVAIYIDQD